MTSQIPCLNLISHSITPENDVAMRLSGSDVPVCLRRGGLRKTLLCEQFGSTRRKRQPRDYSWSATQSTGAQANSQPRFRAKTWRLSGLMFENRAAVCSCKVGP